MTDSNRLGLVLAIALGAGTPALAADGETLFKFHGCINCHGVEAKNPVSKVVPTLAGKPQDELLKKAKAILTGKGATKESQIMHAAFYSPAQCDMPPSDADLAAITAYISAIPAP